MEAEGDGVLAGRLVWAALIAGFALSTAVGGLLYEQVIARLSRAEAMLDTHMTSGGHEHSLTMLEALREQQMQSHTQLESRISRIERKLDDLDARRLDDVRKGR